MQFQVPQFIEVEDKIFGPLTLRQFIYLAGGTGIIVILWISLPRALAVLIGLPIGIFSAALAFYKVNERPFIHLLESAFNYTLGDKLYLWRKQDKPIEKSESAESAGALITAPKLSENRLKELAWSLDIKEHITVERRAGGDTSQRAIK